MSVIVFVLLVASVSALPLEPPTHGDTNVTFPQLPDDSELNSTRDTDVTFPQLPDDSELNSTRDTNVTFPQLPDDSELNSTSLPLYNITERNGTNWTGRRANSPPGRTCGISLCLVNNLGDRLTQGGDETAGKLTSDANGFGKK